MRRLRLVFTLMLIPLALRVYAYQVPYESWMGSFVGDKKIGYLSYKIDKAEFEGVQGYRIASVLNNRLTILGADLTQLVTTVVYTDSSYAPIREDFTVSSGGKTTTVRATFKKDSVDCVISAGSGVSNKTVPIPNGASLVGDAMFVMPDGPVEIGKEYNLHYFNPLTLAIEDLKVRIEREEKLTIGDQTYQTVVLANITPMGQMTIWQERNGDMVQVEAMMGIRMIRQTEKEAISGLESANSQDFGVLTSVKTDRDIHSPRNVKSLDIVFKGVDDPKMLITDSRQSAEKVKGQPGVVHYAIKTSSFDSDKSIKLPVDPKQFEEYLASTPYLDCDLADVKSKAKEIVGDEANAYVACTKIRKWVFENMTVRGDIGITRSASDVLKSKVGVCRDYGILTAALARAAGIPAKIAAGLLYTNGGFYYHVWVECYVGEWVPFDATLNTDFVDATHIKLAEGDATSMFGLASVIGNLKAEIKDYK
ncbi:MAG: transglutaminase domain-containing protein [Armatimonadota bacterium]|nr:transglutaminase-like domain-containing protein [bacterium]